MEKETEYSNEQQYPFDWKKSGLKGVELANAILDSYRISHPIEPHKENNWDTETWGEGLEELINDIRHDGSVDSVHIHEYVRNTVRGAIKEEREKFKKIVEEHRTDWENPMVNTLDWKDANDWTIDNILMKLSSISKENE